MGTVEQIAVVSGLPKFCGTLRDGDVKYRGPNIKTFLRSLDNHFEQHQIINDNKKIQILFAQIDKDKGNALEVVTCQALNAKSYEQLTQRLLKIYPNLNASEFRCASLEYFRVNVQKPTITDGLTKLTNQTQAVVEAYLSRDEVKKLGIKPNTKLDVPGTHVIVAGDANNAVAPDVEDKIPVTEITLQDIMQGMLMHMILAAQLHHKTYEKLKKETPQLSSCALFALAASVVEQEAMIYNKKSQNDGDSILFNINHQNRAQPRRNNVRPQQQQQQQPRNSQQPARNSQQPARNNQQPARYSQQQRQPPRTNYQRPQTTNNYARSTITCFQCNKTGHMAKDCVADENCSYCNMKGHTASMCRKKKAQGLYCENCGMSDSHTARYCRVKTKNGNRARSHQVNAIDGIENPDQQYDEDGNYSNDTRYD